MPYYMLLIVSLVILGGCSTTVPDVSNIPNDVVSHEVADVSVDTLEEKTIDTIAYDGDWVAYVTNTSMGDNAVSDVSMRFVKEGEDITASFVATLSTDIAQAIKITLGDGYIGFLDDTTFIMDWTGSRGDRGRATIRYDKDDDVLIWTSDISSSTDYTLPKEMILRRGIQ